MSLMAELNREQELSGTPSSSALITEQVGDRKIPFGMRTTEGDGKQMIERKVLYGDFTSADVTTHIVTLHNPAQIDRMYPGRHHSRSASQLDIPSHDESTLRIFSNPFSRTFSVSSTMCHIPRMFLDGQFKTMDQAIFSLMRQHGISVLLMPLSRSLAAFFAVLGLVLTLTRQHLFFMSFIILSCRKPNRFSMSFVVSLIIQARALSESAISASRKSQRRKQSTACVARSHMFKSIMIIPKGQAPWLL